MPGEFDHETPIPFLSVWDGLFHGFREGNLGQDYNASRQAQDLHRTWLPITLNLTLCTAAYIPK